MPADAAICDIDCLHCIYPDCILDRTTPKTMQEQTIFELEIMQPKGQKAQHRAAQRHTYYLINKEWIVCKKKAYQEVNPEIIAQQHRASRERCHEQIVKAKKLYVQKHQEEISEYQAKYRESNKEKLANYFQNYHRAHAAQKSAYYRKYRETHKEILRQKYQDYYQSNKEKIMTRQKVYREAHREEIGVKARSRYQAKKAQQSALEAQQQAEAATPAPEIPKGASNG